MPFSPSGPSALPPFLITTTPATVPVPQTVPGLSLWFDGSDASTITSSAGAISIWRDKAQGVLAKQATGSKQPTVVVAGQNGLNTVRFTAANSQQFDFDRIITTDPDYTLFAVFKRSAVSTVAITLGSVVTGNVAGMIYSDNFLYADNSVNYYIGTPGDSTRYSIVTVARTTSIGRGRVNRAEVGMSSAAGVHSAAFDSIGSLSNSVWSDATVGEIILYNRLLSDAEITVVEAYLQAKWATPDLPVGWIAQEDTARIKRKFTQLDEVVQAPSWLPAAGTLPMGWLTQDYTAHRKRKFCQLDEVVQAPSSTGLPVMAVPVGWIDADTPRPRRRILPAIDGEAFPPQAPPTAPPPPFGWHTVDDTAPRKRRYFRLDETAERVRWDVPVSDALTDTGGAPLTDVGGTQLTDVFGAPSAIVIFLTSGTTFTRPGDWNDTNNTIEAIGAGADSSSTTGGIGGCYAKISNYVLPATFTYQIGVHGGTTGAGTAPTANTWGTGATTLVAAGSASSTTNCVGSVVFAGGGSGAGFGGGGAAGPHGAGNTASSSTGGSGDAGFGGAGGAPGNPPLAGGNGAEWTSNPGGATAGSGGGGGKAQVSAQPGGAGGLYGGAAGGRFTSGTGAGANGIIVLTYIPLAPGGVSLGWSEVDSPIARKKRYRQLDEVVQAPSSTGLPPPTPSFGWNSSDDRPAVRRRASKALDEISIPIRSPQAAPWGWADGDNWRQLRTKRGRLDEIADAPSPFGLPAPNFGWSENDAPARRVRRPIGLLDNATPLFQPATPTPSIFWLTQDDTAPRKRRFRQLDETIQAPSGDNLPPFVSTPSTMWLTADETAPRKRRYRQLDETAQAPSPDNLVFDPTLFGMWFIGADQPANDWNISQTSLTLRRRYHQLDNLELVPSPFGLPAPSPAFGWNDNFTTQRIKRRFRQPDNQELVPSPFGLPPLLPSFGWALADEARARRKYGRQLDNEELVSSPLGLPAPNYGWASHDELRRRFVRYRQFDDTLGTISPPTAAANFGWNVQDDNLASFRLRRSRLTRLDDTAYGLIPPPPPVAPNFGWNSVDPLWRYRKKFVILDEVVIPLRLPPGLPVPVPPPPPQSHCDQRKALLGPFVFGPNTPQLGDLAVAVLQDLGVLETGQPVAPEDAMTIIGRLYPKLEELNERDIAYIDADNIANAQFLPLVKIMAAECASAFTIVDPMKLQTLQARGGIGGEAEGTLKDIVRLRTPRQVMRTELFSRNPYGRRYW